MRSWIILTILLLCFSLSALSQSSVKPNLTKPTFLLSYIDYPDVQEYVDLVESIYSELGFEVTLLAVPPGRGLILLEQGRVDADVVRIKESIIDLPNLLIVNPPLQEAELSLICLKEIKCDSAMLKNQKVDILVNKGVLNLFDPTSFQAYPIEFDRIEKFPQMLNAKHHFYAMYVLDDRMHRDMEQNFHMEKVNTVYVHHVIHKKHAALLSRIEQKLQDKLPALHRARK